MEYKVEIAGSDASFTVGPGKSILEAALEAGRRFPYSCRSGNCGTCKGQVLRGEIDYGTSRPTALSDAEHASGFALLCLARPQSDLLVSVREIDSSAAITPRILPCRVARMQLLAPDVMGLWLALPSTERLQFLAGQYIEILLREGRARSFSLANPPHADEFLELHVRHYAGGRFSEYVFTQMREKALLRLRGPLGSFYLREDSERPIVLAAGGTGFAPIKSMVEHVLARGVTRPLHLYWGARSRRDLYLDELPRTWAETHSKLSYVPVLSEPAAEDHWTGRTGFVHAAICEDFPDLTPFEVYASGPPPMIAAARAAFPAQGLDAEHLYSDPFEFAADPVPAPAPET